VALLVLLALLRAEQGVSEVRGRSDAPSRILRLLPTGDGRWFISFLGWEGWLDARVVLVPGDPAPEKQ